MLQHQSTPPRLNFCSLVSVNNLPKSTTPLSPPPRCSKPGLHIWWTPHFFRPDLICLQILLLPYSSASLYPSIPRYQNSLHHRHFHCSLQARLLQLSLSQPAQVSDHPAPTDPELSCTCCWQSSQNQSHHSHPPVSTLAKDNWAHWIQAPLTYLQSSHNHPTFISA